MKVIRLKRGYAIRLSDSEFAVLDAMESFALAGDVDESLYLDPPAKAALTNRMKRARDAGFAHASFLFTDEDRRK